MNKNRRADFFYTAAVLRKNLLDKSEVHPQQPSTLNSTYMFSISFKNYYSGIDAEMELWLSHPAFWLEHPGHLPNRFP